MKLPVYILLAFPCLLQAELTFESLTAKAVAKPEDEIVDLHFKFSAAGTKRTRITSMEPSCSCMEAEASKSEYAPGETGEITVHFKVGTMEGELRKSVTVSTNDPKQPNLELTCVVESPKVFVFNTGVMEWEMGSTPGPKTVLIKILTPEPTNIIRVTSTRPNFTPELVTVTAGREYLVKVTPQSVAESELAAITLETDSKIPKYAKRQIFCNVIRPRK